MKQIFLIILVLINVRYTFGQLISNLVLNPSFENFTDEKCIETGNYSISGYTGWFQSSVKFENQDGTFGWTSPDAYNLDTCGTHQQWNNHIPLNTAGFQRPKSGNGYIGLSFLNHREYPCGTLVSELQVGKIYCLKINVSLAEFSRSAAKNIQIVFHTDSTLMIIPFNAEPGSIPGSFDLALNNIQPIVLSADYVDDTINWISLEASFIADNAYRFFTVGNFNKSSSNIALPLRRENNLDVPFAYYYLDDIAIFDCSDTIPPPEPQFDFEVKAYPNPASEWFNLEYTLPEAGKVRLHITDVFGKMVLARTELAGQKGINTLPIDVNTWAMGQYHVSVLYEAHGQSAYRHLKMQVVR